MADQMVKITIKLSSGSSFEIEASKDGSVLQVKEACFEKSNIPVAHQRLIYRGKILKDENKLTDFDIQNGHTMHLVQSSSSSSSTSARPNTNGSTNTPNPAPQTTMPRNIPISFNSGGNLGGNADGNTGGNMGGNMGQRPTNPLFQMFEFPLGNNMSNPAMGMNQGDMSAFMNMFGALNGGNGANPGNTGSAQNPLNNNQMLSNIMQSMLSNPEVTRQLMTPEFIQAGHQLVWQFMRNNPNSQTQGSTGSNTDPTQTGTNPGANTGTNTATNTATNTGTTTGANPPNMFNDAYATYQVLHSTYNPPTVVQSSSGTPNTSANPAAQSTNPVTVVHESSSTSSSGGNTMGSNQPSFNTFGFPIDSSIMQTVMRQMTQNPQLLQSIMSGMNFPGNNNTSNDGGNMGNGFAQSEIPDLRNFSRMFNEANNTPPEERYSNQLRSLQEMGFIDAAANIQALQESGGDVNAAITRLLERGLGN